MVKKVQTRASISVVTMPGRRRSNGSACIAPLEREIPDSSLEELTSLGMSVVLGTNESREDS